MMSGCVARTAAVWIVGFLMAPGAAAEPIEAGQELKRAIGPGETHSYEVPLSSKQYVRFAIYCEGTRLTAKLVRPNGDVAIVLSDTRQHETPVSLSLIASSGGVHRLTVQLASG